MNQLIMYSCVRTKFEPVGHQIVVVDFLEASNDGGFTIHPWTVVLPLDLQGATFRPRESRSIGVRRGTWVRLETVPGQMPRPQDVFAHYTDPDTLRFVSTRSTIKLVDSATRFFAFLPAITPR